jgi:hypothetical protein
MNIWGIALIVGLLIACFSAFVWVAMRLGTQTTDKEVLNDSLTVAHKATEELAQQAKQEVQYIFDDNFRKELKDTGKVHFEKIIAENAMFLQQDLRLTTSNLNEYLKKEISRTLQEEFSHYSESINDAKVLAIASIEKTQVALEQQRTMLEDEIKVKFAQERAIMIAKFEKNMANIINHYVIDAIGNEIDLSDQLEYIIQHLESNKTALIQDLEHGA